MPEHPSRFVAALYDQDEDHRIPDWGGDELFTRMPRPRAVDDAPPPRFRPALALVDPPLERRRFSRDHPPLDPPEPPAPRRPELTLVDGPPAGATVRQWDGSLPAAAPGRPTRVITGRPDGAPRFAPMPADRRGPARSRPRTRSEWVGPRPERIVGWAFALGLLLILIAITTADAATL